MASINPHLYGPGVSFTTTPSPLDDYSIALTALHASNGHLERKMEKLHTSTLSLRRELLTLQRHILSFRHEQLVTWQADILTRLIEVMYERQGQKLPWGAVWDRKRREDVSKVYVAAARRIDRRALWTKLGLTSKYHQALGKYAEVVDFRSSDPARTEITFAQWLVSEKENSPRMYDFWARLYPICYGRSVVESAQVE
ncbi:hypothetical protein VTN02DRAFT_3669 [Thermoascus thermophilus]